MDDSWPNVTAALRRAGYREWTPHVRKRDRRFGDYRFRLILGGRGLLSVDLRQHPVSAGDVLIMPPGTPALPISMPPIRSYWLSGTIRVRGAASPDALAALPTLLTPQPHAWQLLREAEEMCREVREKRPAHQLFASAAFTRFIALLCMARRIRVRIARPALTPLTQRTALAPSRP